MELGERRSCCWRGSWLVGVTVVLVLLSWAVVLIECSGWRKPAVKGFCVIRSPEIQPHRTVLTLTSTLELTMFTSLRSAPESQQLLPYRLIPAA